MLVSLIAQCSTTPYAPTDFTRGGQWSGTMFKPGSGRKPDSGVWRYFDYESSADKSRCKVPDCGVMLKGKNATNMLTHLRSKHKGDKTIAEQLDKAEQDRKKKDLKNLEISKFYRQSRRNMQIACWSCIGA